MKKIKILVICSPHYDTPLPESVKKDLTDWTEVSDEYYDFLISSKYNIENRLKSKKIIDYGDELIFLRQLSDEDYKDAFDEIMNEEYEQYKQKLEKDRIKKEKEKARREKQKQVNKEKQKEKELEQLKKLKEKYE